MENLWSAGSFWLLAFVVLIRMVVYLMKLDFRWYKYVFIGTSIPILLLIIGALTFKSAYGYSDESFFKLMELALTTLIKLLQIGIKNI